MAILLKILCFLGGVDVPEIILSRANSPHKSWGGSSEVEEVTAFEAGLYIDLLANIAEINNIIRCLASYILITTVEGAF